MPVTIFRILASAVSITGLILLGLTLSYWDQGDIAAKYYPGIEHTSGHHLAGLLLALPVPLHVTFIGLIIQKKYLSRPWQRLAWIGITGSGIWLGISLLIRMM